MADADAGRPLANPPALPVAPRPFTAGFGAVDGSMPIGRPDVRACTSCVNPTVIRAPQTSTEFAAAQRLLWHHGARMPTPPQLERILPGLWTQKRNSRLRSRDNRHAKQSSLDLLAPGAIRPARCGNECRSCCISDSAVAYRLPIRPYQRSDGLRGHGPFLQFLALCGATWTSALFSPTRRQIPLLARFPCMQCWIADGASCCLSLNPTTPSQQRCVGLPRIPLRC